MKTNYSRKSSFWQDLSSKSRVYAKPLCKPINKIMLNYDPGRRILSHSLSLSCTLRRASCKMVPLWDNKRLRHYLLSAAPEVSEVRAGWSVAGRSVNGGLCTKAPSQQGSWTRWPPENEAVFGRYGDQRGHPWPPVFHFNFPKPTTCKIGRAASPQSFCTFICGAAAWDSYPRTRWLFAK